MLSPILWLLVTNAGLMLMESRVFKVAAYADDMIILVGGKFLSTLGEVMESEFYSRGLRIVAWV